MLVLSRKCSEKLLIPGIQTAIQVVSIKPGVVRLGIDAPPEVAVVRAELEKHPEKWSALIPPATAGLGAMNQELRHELRNRLNAATVAIALLRRQKKLGLVQESDRTLDQLGQEVEAMCKYLEQLSEKPAQPAPSRPARRKALVVEDDTNERELLAGFLRLAGLEVTTAGDGLDALKYLHGGARPDVVLLDMGLPRCDGVATVRAIREDPECSGMKVFAVTGRPPEELAIREGETGVNRWFQKPVNPELLLRQLECDLAGTA